VTQTEWMILAGVKPQLERQRLLPKLVTARWWCRAGGARLSSLSLRPLQQLPMPATLLATTQLQLHY